MKKTNTFRRVLSILLALLMAVGVCSVSLTAFAGAGTPTELEEDDVHEVSVGAAVSLTVDPQGGYWNGTTADSVFSQETYTARSVADPKRTGYDFKGWALDGYGISPDFGIPYFSNPSFRGGSNGFVGVYNNAGNGMVAHALVAKDAACPTNSSHMLRITTSGAAAPGHGGFVNSVNSSAGSEFYHVFIAKIPVGYQVYHANNPISGSQFQWLTSREGTGEWETYIYRLTCGKSGSFSTFGYVYLTGGSAPVTWYVGYTNVYNAVGKDMGTPRFNDTAFANGTNSMNPYAYTGGVTVTRVGKSAGAPALGSYEVEIYSSKETGPSYGGFVQNTISYANAEFYHVFVAKIPVGYTVYQGNNAVGTGSSFQWLTPQAGTGNYETYIYKLTCGPSGSFSDFGYVYLRGSAPVTWRVAYSNMFDATSVKRDSNAFVFGTGAGTLLALWNKGTYNLKIDPNGGTYNGSSAVTSASRRFDGRLDIVNPARTGYTFAGWKVEGQGTLPVRGNPLFHDTSFSAGTNGMYVYNNLGNGTVTVNRIAKSADCPAEGNYMVRITTTGSASPELGGFVQNTPSKAGGIFYHVIVAKLPAGSQLHWHGNPTGDGRTVTWLTSQAGTGAWRTYICRTNCGATGSFQGFGHISLSGASLPATWDVAYANMFDATSVEWRSYNVAASKLEGLGTMEDYGVPLCTDTSFAFGTNNMAVYNNLGNGTVTLNRVAKSADCPTDGDYMVRITTNGTASPNMGGFHQSTLAKPGGIFYHVIVAKLPAGSQLNWHGNAGGEGRVITWLTPQRGTGKWETYVCRTICGTTGSFSSFGHIALSGASLPATWDVAYANMFDASGTMLHTDPGFASGVNSIGLYNNSGNGNVTVTRITNSVGAPTPSGYVLQVRTAGAASPSHGGIYQATQSYPNAVFYHIILAKIPVGYNISCASNAVGDGAAGWNQNNWITSRAGTGNWQTYICRTVCGSTGTFSTLGHVYLEGGSAPVTWYIASASMLDATASAPSAYIFGGKDAKLTAQWRVNTYTVTYKANGAAGADITDNATYDIPFTVRAASTFAKTGYTLTSWACSAGGSYAPGQANVKNLTPAHGANVVMTAQWTANAYYYKFSPGYTGGGADTGNYNATYDVNFELPDVMFNREMYAFTGWSCSTNNTFYPAYSVIKNVGTAVGQVVTFTAQWSDNAHYVRYEGNGATSGSMQRTSHIRSEASNLRALGFAKTGYTFKYWTLTQADSTTNWGNGAAIQNFAAALTTVTLYAQWQPNTYTVTYNAGGGTGANIPTTQTYDAAFNTMNNPYSKVGYLFVDWLCSNGQRYGEGVELLNLTAAVNGSLNMTAQWRPITYTVTYLPGTAPGSAVAQTHTYDVDYSAAASGTYYVEGYRISAWRCSNGQSFAPGAVVKNVSATQGAAVTMTAQWVPITYTIVYRPGGASGSNITVTATYDAPFITKPSTTYSRGAGYNFSGWLCSNGQTFAADVDARNLTATQGATLYLDAQWTAKETFFIVRYVSGLGDGEDVDFSLPLGGTFTLKGAELFSRTGYHITQWYCDFNNTYYLPGSTPGVLTRDPNTLISMIAVWTPNDIRIVYDANGAASGTMPVSLFKYNTMCNLLPNAYSISGAQFTGWNTKPDGSGTSYPNRANAFNIITGGTVTLYAQWNYTERRVTFVTNGGAPKAAVNIAIGAPLSSITAPTYDAAHEFAGWYMDEALTTPLSYTTMPDADVTLYAKWNMVTRNIALTVNGSGSVTAYVNNVNRGKISGSLTVNYGDTVRLIANPGENSEFASFTANGAALEENYPIVITANTNVTATFNAKIVQYTVTVVGGTVFKQTSATVSANTLVTIVPDDAASLGCWALDAQGDTVISESSTFAFVVTGDATVYAITKEAEKPSVTLFSAAYAKSGTKYKLTYTGIVSAPNGWTVTGFGLLMVKSPAATFTANEDSFIYTNAKVGSQTISKVAASSLNTAGQYKVSVTSVPKSTSAAARMYLICKDANGATAYFYSEVAYITTP